MKDNLSSKIDTFHDMDYDEKILHKKDVKEFIKRLEVIVGAQQFTEIKELAGEDLI